MTGWISLHRKITENTLWQDKPFSKGQAWIDLLLMTNHKDNTFLLGSTIVNVKRGSFITSELKLMRKWGWSKSKVRAFLLLLSNQKMLIKKTDHKKTTLTICNYDTYQEEQTTKEPVKDHKRTSKRPVKDTNNNVNNENNENNENNNILPDLETWQNFGYKYARDYFDFPISKQNLFAKLHNSHEYWFGSDNKNWTKEKRKDWKKTVQTKVRSEGTKLKDWEEAKRQEESTHNGVNPYDE